MPFAGHHREGGCKGGTRSVAICNSQRLRDGEGREEPDLRGCVYYSLKRRSLSLVLFWQSRKGRQICLLWRFIESCLIHQGENKYYVGAYGHLDLPKLEYYASCMEAVNDSH